MAKYGDIFPMEDYYQKKIRPLEWKFKRRKSGKIVCPFHDDDRPSLGFMKNSDGSEIFHCFGCGAKGDIVTMHQRMEKEYYGRNISREKALQELCEIFEYPYAQLKDQEKQEQKEKVVKVQRFYRELETPMTIKKFVSEFNKAKKDKKDIRYFNSILIQMIMANNAENNGA